VRHGDENWTDIKMNWHCPRNIGIILSRSLEVLRLYCEITWNFQTEGRTRWKENVVMSFLGVLIEYTRHRLNSGFLHGKYIIILILLLFSSRVVYFVLSFICNRKSQTYRCQSCFNPLRSISRVCDLSPEQREDSLDMLHFLL
jgi:hypothetical protein